LADNFPLLSDPGPSDTFTQYGITAFEAQYSTNSGGSWSDVPGGSVVGNNLIWRKFTFSAISGVTNVRVLVHNSLQSYSRVVELEAWGGGSGSSTPSIFQINFGNSCAIVMVTKNADGTTKIDSRGYNTCSGSAARRYERGITTTY
jgi:hypothetical protein